MGHAEYGRKEHRCTGRENIVPVIASSLFAVLEILEEKINIELGVI